MNLPQTLTIEFTPVGSGDMAEITIDREYECEDMEILELLNWAVEAFGDAMIQERLERIKKRQ